MNGEGSTAIVSTPAGPTEQASYRLFGVLLVSATVCAVAYASIAFTRETDSVATFWPANAIVLAALLRGNQKVLRDIGAILVGGGAALFASNAIAGNNLALSSALSAANLVEIGAAFWLLRHFQFAPADITRPRHLSLFLASAAASAPIAGATIGASAVAMALSVPWLPTWLTWYAADALGMAIVAPLALLMGAKQLTKLHEEKRIFEATAVLALIVLVASVASYYRLLLFLVVPVVLFATFRFGILGAAVGIISVALISTLFVVLGVGPMLLSQSTMSERIFILQIFLATTVLWSLPVAAALAERDRLAQRLSCAKVDAEAIAEEKSRAVALLWHRLWNSQEEERQRLAHELHDRTGQDLAVMMLELKQAESLSSNAELPRLHRLREQLESMGATLRRVAWELRPASIEELGLARALGEYVDGWSEKFGIDAAFYCNDAHVDACPSDVCTTLYRIAQEALTNVAQHAGGATTVSVTISRVDDIIRLTIDDDGCGFDSKSAASGTVRLSGGLGLIGMRDRMALIGGTLDIESSKGNGTAISARIPLRGTGQSP